MMTPSADADAVAAAMDCAQWAEHAAGVLGARLDPMRVGDLWPLLPYAADDDDARAYVWTSLRAHPEITFTRAAGDGADGSAPSGGKRKRERASAEAQSARTLSRSALGGMSVADASELRAHASGCLSARSMGVDVATLEALNPKQRTVLAAIGAAGAAGVLNPDLVKVLSALKGLALAKAKVGVRKSPDRLSSVGVVGAAELVGVADTDVDAALSFGGFCRSSAVMW